MLRIVVLLFLTSFPIWAHTGHLNPSSGFQTGFMHPLLGLDHLFAMLCVGVASSRLGGHSIWRIPALFIITMMGGFMVGKHGMPFPYFESLIALSLVVFGIMLVPSIRLKAQYIILPVMVFALAHGYAHGSEIGMLNNSWKFQQGFLLASIIIHIIGVAIGMIPTHHPVVERLVKAAFVGIAVYGFVLL